MREECARTVGERHDGPQALVLEHQRGGTERAEGHRLVFWEGRELGHR